MPKTSSRPSHDASPSDLFIITLESVVTSVGESGFAVPFVGGLGFVVPSVGGISVGCADSCGGPWTCAPSAAPSALLVTRLLAGTAVLGLRMCVGWFAAGTAMESFTGFGWAVLDAADALGAVGAVCEAAVFCSAGPEPVVSCQACSGLSCHNQHIIISILSAGRSVTTALNASSIYRNNSSMN